MALNDEKCISMCLGSSISLDEFFIYNDLKLNNTTVNETLHAIINRELKFENRVNIFTKKVVVS